MAATRTRVRVPCTLKDIYGTEKQILTALSNSGAPLGWLEA
jgi:hypothetical protein